MIRTTRFATLFVLAAALLAGCATTQINTAEEKDRLAREAQASRQEWNKLDPTAEGFVKKGYGYAFFPEIGKGGFIFAGGGGHGVVYEQGQHVGYAELVEGSIGFTVGGQSYSELIVFENKAAMDRFKKGEMNFGANASAVIAKAGAGANAAFHDGVAVFVRPLAGAMLDASLGGQHIKYIPR